MLWHLAQHPQRIATLLASQALMAVLRLMTFGIPQCCGICPAAAHHPLLTYLEGTDGGAEADDVGVAQCCGISPSASA